MKKYYNLTILYLIKKNFINLKNQLTWFSVDVDQIVVSYKFTKDLSILLVTEKVKLLNHYALSYLKWVDTPNTLKMGVKTCLFWLRMIKCGIDMMKFGMWLKIN